MTARVREKKVSRASRADIKSLLTWRQLIPRAQSSGRAVEAATSGRCYRAADIEWNKTGLKGKRDTKELLLHAARHDDN